MLPLISFLSILSPQSLMRHPHPSHPAWLNPPPHVTLPRPPSSLPPTSLSTLIATLQLPITLNHYPRRPITIVTTTHIVVHPHRRPSAPSHPQLLPSPPRPHRHCHPRRRPPLSPQSPSITTLATPSPTALPN